MSSFSSAFPTTVMGEKAKRTWRVKASVLCIKSGFCPCKPPSQLSQLGSHKGATESFLLGFCSRLGCLRSSASPLVLSSALMHPRETHGFDMQQPTSQFLCHRRRRNLELRNSNVSTIIIHPFPAMLMSECQ